MTTQKSIVDQIKDIIMGTGSTPEPPEPPVAPPEPVVTPPEPVVPPAPPESTPAPTPPSPAPPEPDPRVAELETTVQRQEQALRLLAQNRPTETPTPEPPKLPARGLVLGFENKELTDRIAAEAADTNKNSHGHVDIHYINPNKWSI